MGAVALLAVAGASLVLAPAAWAHAPDVAVASAGQGAWRWNTAPWLLALLGASLAAYAIGVSRLWRQAGVKRGITTGQVAAFAAGWLALVAALASPLDALGSRLFSAHMLQHEVLMIVAAPLLVLGRPFAAWTWALPLSARMSLPGAVRRRWLATSWAALTHPLSAWSLHAIALWAWHVPALFEAALRHEGLHILQHASFFVTALLFWWSALGGDPRSRRRGAAMAYLFTTMMHTAALGALLTLAPTAWYPDYVASSVSLGVDPVEDQQLGGLVMWVPGGLVYLAAALALVARLLRPRGLSLRT
jgi:putative membrane protein